MKDKNNNEELIKIIENSLDKIGVLEEKLDFNYSMLNLVQNKLIKKNKLKKQIKLMINDTSIKYTDLESEKLKENNILIEKEIALINKKKIKVENHIKEINNNLESILMELKINNIKVNRDNLSKSLLDEKIKIQNLNFKTVNNKRNDIYINKYDEINVDKYRKVYVIDTNIFVEEPNILDYINSNDLIIISKTVVDELDSNKHRKEIAYNVREAIRNISNYNSDNMIFVQADRDILPYDYKIKGDNLILSAAIQFKKYSPIIVTNDIAFRLKAKGEGIKAIKLTDIIGDNN